MTVALVAAHLGIALATQSFGVLIEITGGFAGSMLYFVFPAMLYWKLAKRSRGLSRARGGGDDDGSEKERGGGGGGGGGGPVVLPVETLGTAEDSRLPDTVIATATSVTVVPVATGATEATEATEATTPPPPTKLSRTMGVVRSRGGRWGGVWRGALALFVVGVLIMIVSLSMVTYIAVANPYPEPDHCKAGRNMTVLNDLQGGE